jgi:hypothetical protein
MTYRIGFDGLASAEVTHMLRAVQNGLNGSSAGMLTHVRAEDVAASAPIVPCTKNGKICGDGQGPIEPPNVVVIHTVVLAAIVVVSVVVGVIVGYGLGKKSAAPNVRN